MRDVTKMDVHEFLELARAWRARRQAELAQLEHMLDVRPSRPPRRPWRAVLRALWRRHG